MKHRLNKWYTYRLKKEHMEKDNGTWDLASVGPVWILKKLPCTQECEPSAYKYKTRVKNSTLTHCSSCYCATPGGCLHRSLFYMLMPWVCRTGTGVWQQFPGKVPLVSRVWIHPLSWPISRQCPWDYYTNVATLVGNLAGNPLKISH